MAPNPSVEVTVESDTTCCVVVVDKECAPPQTAKKKLDFADVDDNVALTAAGRRTKLAKRAFSAVFGKSPRDNSNCERRAATAEEED